MIFTIQAKIRYNTGTKSSRRTRKTNKNIPAIIYGKCKTPIPIEINFNIFLKQQQIKKQNKELTIIINNDSIKVKIQSIQYHPYKLKPIHIDFIRT